MLSSETERLLTRTILMELSSTKSSPLLPSLHLRPSKLLIVNIRSLTMSTILTPFITVLLTSSRKHYSMLLALRPTLHWEMDLEELNISTARLLASITTILLTALKCLLSQFTMSSIEFRELTAVVSLITLQSMGLEEISLLLFLHLLHRWWSHVPSDTQMFS